MGNEETLKADIAKLKEQKRDMEKFTEHLTDYVTPGENTEEGWDIIQAKVENEKLKAKLKEVEDLYRIKIGQYEKVFALKETRKAKIEELEKQLKMEAEKRKVEEGKLKKKIDQEKVKLDKEKDKRIEVLKERNELMAEGNELREKVGIAESNWVDLKVKVDDLEEEWEKSRTSYHKTIEPRPPH